MRVLFSLFILFLLAACDSTDTPAESLTKAPENKTIQYPETRTVAHTDNYHGVTVKDPYRWLEELDSKETREWINAQNELTFAYLGSLAGRESIKQRLGQLWSYARITPPYKKGGLYFFRQNNGQQNQSMLMVTDNPDKEARVLLDPNSLSQDGTVALRGTAVSPDGRFLAYGLAEGGSDWNTWHVRDIETGENLTDRLDWVKFSGASWSPDSQGFYYSRYDSPEGKNKLKAVNRYQKLYYHKLGDPQEKDVLVYERPDQEKWGFGGRVTDDGQYLTISVWRGTEQKNLFFYKSLTDKDTPVVELLNDWVAEFNFLGNVGSIFYFHTDDSAERYRVIAIDTENPARENWREILPESKDTLEAASMAGDVIVATYLHDASHRVVIHHLENGSQEVNLPGIGRVDGFELAESENETFYSFTSFSTPGTIYRLDLTTGKNTLFRQPELAFNPEDYVTTQIFYESKDGTKVPMFISHHKNVTPDKNTPTLLYAYGGFNISMKPRFSASNLVWMEMGGIYAMPNLRGGGEYGRKWHEAGTRLNKQNVFDDFIAAARWLIANNYTSPEKLAIKGGSNGGLLVGATMLQAPELFAAALPAVGVMDMLRFTEFTIGWAWTSDYGSPKNEDEFKALYAYSPLHNLKPGSQYPATLVTTGDHDDRVFPAHSFKFAAALQAAQTGDAPTLIRIETRGGHGAGKPVSMQVEEAADQLVFLKENLSIE